MNHSVELVFVEDNEQNCHEHNNKKHDKGVSKRHQSFLHNTVGFLDEWGVESGKYLVLVIEVSCNFIVSISFVV